VARGVGIERVRVLDCYDLEEVEAVLTEELAAAEPSVIVAKRPCVTGARLALRRQFRVDAEACRGCRACLRLGCPALELGDADPERPKLQKVRVNSVLCAGCSLCQQVCTHGAIAEVALER
jgi:indolepyruvate ferredoxin oxidoreductase alpha subunit